VLCAGVNKHLLSNVPGVYICGNPNLGDVSTSVGAYSNFIESMLHEFQGLSLRCRSSHIFHEVMMKAFQCMYLYVIAHPACIVIRRKWLRALSIVAAALRFLQLLALTCIMLLTQWLVDWELCADNQLPVVNITGMVISQIGYGSHGFGKTGRSHPQRQSDESMRWLGKCPC
jgi:hypothetical protein